MYSLHAFSCFWSFLNFNNLMNCFTYVKLVYQIADSLKDDWITEITFMVMVWILCPYNNF